VEKSEGNGLHDGRLVRCPTARVEGKSYQRVIKTEGADGWAYDLRTACVAGRPVVVFVKQRPATARFSIQNTSVVVKAPNEVFSTAEIAEIERFCAAMRLDWGGLDVLREHESGRLYVVDVNKTDTGPAVVLSWKDRARATRVLAEALREMVSA
jgi:glutathione synthase/RimK-type ligase-like ATP-grasp enzyme